MLHMCNSVLKTWQLDGVKIKLDVYRNDNQFRKNENDTNNKKKELELHASNKKLSYFQRKI